MPASISPRLGLVLLCLLPLSVRATGTEGANPPAPKIESSTGRWVFSLLPRSFQTNPLVDQTVITEMTDEGRKRPLATPSHPVYYVTEVAGYHEEGHGTAAEQPPSPVELAANLHRALLVNGIRPATRDHPPSLVIVYFWGVDNLLDPGSEDVGGAFPDVGHKNLLARAALVGGTKFAEELRVALQKHDHQVDGVDLVGDIADPVRLLIQSNPKNQQLFEQSQVSCFYIVASAYDYAALARGKHELLWRSKMTVDTGGVSMDETLPNLLLNAGQYLGRDMPESATFVRRAQGDTSVKLGPLDVREYLTKPAAPNPDPDAPAPSKP